MSQLVTRYGNRPLDQEFFDVLALVEGALHAGHDAELTGQLLWLQNELEKHREKRGG